MVQSFVPQGAGEGWPVHIYTELTVPNLKQGLLNEEGEKTNRYSQEELEKEPLGVQVLEKREGPHFDS